MNAVKTYHAEALRLRKSSVCYQLTDFLVQKSVADREHKSSQIARSETESAQRIWSLKFTKSDAAQSTGLVGLIGIALIIPIISMNV